MSFTSIILILIYLICLFSISQEACHAIVERLERLLNLRIVTKGTETYEVMEDCIRIVRGVIEDHIVYVRSRHRPCMDQQ